MLNNFRLLANVGCFHVFVLLIFTILGELPGVNNIWKHHVRNFRFASFISPFKLSI